MNSSYRQSGNDTPLEFFAAVRRYAKCGCGRSGLPRSIATCVGRNDWGHLNRTPNFDPLILPEEAYLGGDRVQWSAHPGVGYRLEPARSRWDEQ